MLFHSFILWGALYGRVVPGAYISVNMFFVLSGFLITSFLLTERERKVESSFGSFYQRRALRLLPAFVLLLAVFTVYVLVRCTARSRRRARRGRLDLDLRVELGAVRRAR